MIKTLLKHILITFLLVSVSFVAFTQEKGLIFSKLYSSKDYNAGAQNWCITQDNRGVLYFGNTSGILEYDGVNWRKIKVTNNSAVRSLAFDKNNILYVGAHNELGFMSPDNTGDLIYNSIYNLVDSAYKNFGTIWDINSFSDSIFFLTDEYVLMFHNNKFKYWKSNKDRYYLSHKVGDSYYVQEMGRGLLKFKNDSLLLVDKGNYFSDIRIHSILPLGDKYLICTRTEGLYIYDSATGKTKIKSFSQISNKTKELNNYFIKNIFYHGISLTDSTYALSTLAGNILIIDNKFNIIDIINNETIGIKSAIHYLYHQKNQSLWIALGNGISQVEIQSPYRFWNDDKGIHGTFTDIARLKDKLYISTGSGIYYTNSENSSQFETNSFSHIDGIFEQTWGFLYFQPPYLKFDNNPFGDSILFNITRTNKTKLLVSSSRGLFEIIDDKSVQISNHKPVFKIYQYKKDPSILFLGLNKGIVMLSYDNGIWKDHGYKFGIDYMISEIEEDTIGNLWISSDFNGVYKIKNPIVSEIKLNNISFFDTSCNLPTLNNVQIENYHNTIYFRSNNKLYTYNSEINDFDLFNFQDVTTTIDFNENEDSLTLNRVNEDIITNFFIIDKDDPSEWFGTNMGTCRYIYKDNKDYNDVSPSIIRKVLANDSIVYNGTNFNKFEDDTRPKDLINTVKANPKVDIGTILKFSDNSLSFHYSSVFFEKESENRYSFCLTGYDDEWSEWSSATKKEYNYLREGDYIFKVKTKNIYNIESPVAEFNFKVLSPWYRSITAYFGYSIFAIIVIALIVKLYTRKLIREKNKLEGTVDERTQEILMQKEEILVQAESLKDANEEITTRNNELEKQKLEITDQRDKLELSNATKNKFFRIIAHDLRGPISTLAGSTNLIFNDFEEFDSEQTKEFIGELSRLSQTTYNLLENLLEWSSTQTGDISFNPQPINILLIVNENIELIKQKVDLKNIKLKLNIDTKTVAFADENMVKTIYRNLLSNAVKFTPKNGEIEISTNFNKNFIYCTVKDSGIGINETDLKKLFRIDQHYTSIGLNKEKGSGLGLILCKEFIEKNGGEIKIKSTINKGTTIEFTLKNQIS